MIQEHERRIIDVNKSSGKLIICEDLMAGGFLPRFERVDSLADFASRQKVSLVGTTAETYVPRQLFANAFRSSPHNFSQSCKDRSTCLYSI